MHYSKRTLLLTIGACAALAGGEAANATVHVCNAVPVAEKMYFNITDSTSKTHSTGMLSYGDCKALMDVDVGTGSTSTLLSTTTWSGTFSNPKPLSILQNGVDSMVILRPMSVTKGDDFYGTTPASVISTGQSKDEYGVFGVNACVNNGDVEFTQEIAGQEVTVNIVFKNGLTGSSVILSKTDADAGTTKEFEVDAEGTNDVEGKLNAASPFGKSTVVVCTGIKGDADYGPKMMVFGEPVQGGAAGMGLAVAAWAALVGTAVLVSKQTLQ